MHSPFVFEFIFDVLDVSKKYYIFSTLEKDRKSLIDDNSSISIQDFGAGSKTSSQKNRSISDIASSVVSNVSKCRILFNLVNKFQPKTVIELGTSLGISSLYMAYACKNSKIITIEGDPSVYQKANVIFNKHHLKNILSLQGNFDDLLPQQLSNMEWIDIAYIDGNHTYESTMSYFQLLKKKVNQTSILVFDDIYWSDGMLLAWEEIKSDESVCFTIDTFDFGFVFFNPIMEKNHFKIIEYWKKPYRIGLWG